MHRRIEAFLYGRRWRADERAWETWQNLAPLVPSSFAALDSGQPVAGRVSRIYQQAQRGTKAVVHFGLAVGPQDTWWEQMRPVTNQWVVVRTHLWFPPGTHSGQHVVWINGWESRAAGDVYTRALRHERRLEKEGSRTTVTSPALDEDVAWTAPRGPLFQMDAFAAAADPDAAMSAVAEIAAGLVAKTYGPAEVGGGRLLFLWPLDEVPTFVSVTARPIPAGATWIRISAQSLALPSLDVVEKVKVGLEFRLGNLGPEVRPPPREVEYDRVASRQLEAEIQELLGALATDATAWEHLSKSIYERELLLQHLTELGV